MNIINQTFLRSKFPPIKFAFTSNYIQRSFRMRKLNQKPIVETIMVVDDVENWHKQNYTRNKKHYPLLSKFTGIRLVNYFQKKGANIHFNLFTDQEGNILRYGVVDYIDFKNDLKQWKTLTVSTYMQKPYELVIDNPDIYKYQNKNLMSAVYKNKM
jgi:translocator assembly and maintenance protein 41